MRLKTLLIISIFILSCAIAEAAPLKISTKLDSATLLMGKRGNLRIEVVQDKNVKGEFPLFAHFDNKGILTLLNDTVELSKDMAIDTVDIGNGRIQINCNVPIQVFDSGMYQLPSIEFVAGRDTARSNLLNLTVLPVKGLTAETPIKPMTDVSEPENASIFDNVPDWLYYYWWIYLLAIALIAGAIWAWRRYRKEGTILIRKSEESPYDQAMNALKILKGKKLWETGHEKAYYTELTEILRVYLERRFNIRAMEMTTAQIMSTLADITKYDVPREKMRDILDMADFVKFAMVRPLPDDNTTLYNNAVEFVESTRPMPEMSDTEADVHKTSTSVDSGVGAGRRGRSARLSKESKIHAEDRMRVGNHRKHRSVGDDRQSAHKNDGKEVRE